MDLSRLMGKCGRAEAIKSSHESVSCVCFLTHPTLQTAWPSNKLLQKIQNPSTACSSLKKNCQNLNVSDGGDTNGKKGGKWIWVEPQTVSRSRVLNCSKLISKHDPVSLFFFPSAMLELSSPCLKQTNDSTLLLCNSQLQAEQTPSEGNSVVIEPSSIRLPLERFGVMLLRQHYSWIKHKTFFRAERFCRKRLM